MKLVKSIALCSLVVALLLVSGCASVPDMAETFSMAYSQSVSPTVYDENLKAITKYLSPSLQIKLKEYPSYLEETKRASAEMVALCETPTGAISYVSVTVSERTQYTLRFEMTLNDRRDMIDDCTVSVLYSKPAIRLQ